MGDLRAGGSPRECGSFGSGDIYFEEVRCVLMALNRMVLQGITKAQHFGAATGFMSLVLALMEGA